MNTLQIKPYLEVRKLGTTLRIGHLPPNGTEILDAPDFLTDLVALLSAPTDRGAAVAHLVDAGFSPEGAEDMLAQLADARVIGAPIPDSTRYARHLLYFDMMGLDPADAQQVLSNATVAVVGTGGIGSNVATLLATAGVGQLILTDGDHVELSNLTRQFLYDENSVGRPKVEVAAERLNRLNSTVEITTVRAPAGPELFDEHLAQCDLAVLSADSPDELHEWIDDAARRHSFGYLAAGYLESFGAVGPLVLPGTTACYECFRDIGELEQYLEPGEKPGPNLNLGLQAGSYGPLNLIVAAMAANEVLRCLLGGDCRSAGTRLMLDSRSYRLHSEHFPRRSDCTSCGPVIPDPRWSTAVQSVALEDLYESDRADASLNSVVLDPLMEQLTAVKPGAKALDYGCGTGEQVRMLASLGAQVVGFDRSTRMLDMLRQNIPDELVSRVSTVAGDRLPPYEAEFDLVVCNNVLDHVADLAPVLADLRRAVRQDGTVVVTVPHPIKDGASWNRRNDRGQWQYEDLRLEHYFTEGPVTKHREGSQGDIVMDAITTHHRTVQTYFAAFRQAGFQITELYEPQPQDEVASSHPEIWAKASRIPYFLAFVLRPESTGAQSSPRANF
ncbi:MULTISPECIES: ThiF family adenylyltransferase [unclassified Streptomyces]|uniref:ThiF family adenylyltransferase n=1 Tax=unclassified Streptomyces TaxID=2593676 RepID=UPI00224D566D|nr:MULTISPECIES: ThiF family adenylyltransferase [unclassified Streptomyces]MCX5063893.1 ThiF family adenylyltransferase [Streptomyces sp. NBC_00452]